MRYADLILDHIAKNGSITSKEAYDLFGASRLSSIVHRLRKAGYNVETEYERGLTRHGTTARYARYKVNDFK